MDTLDTCAHPPYVLHHCVSALFVQVHLTFTVSVCAAEALCEFWICHYRKKHINVLLYWTFVLCFYTELKFLLLRSYISYNSWQTIISCRTSLMASGWTLSLASKINWSFVTISTFKFNFSLSIALICSLSSSVFLSLFLSSIFFKSYLTTSLFEQVCRYETSPLWLPLLSI